MELSLNNIVIDFSVAFKAVDEKGPVGKSNTRIYKPGVGPLTENVAVTKALTYLQQVKNSDYRDTTPKSYPNSKKRCDLLIPKKWVLEFKLVRPYHDNGKEDEDWSKNLFYPLRGSTGCIGDCIKLAESTFEEKKALLVFGFEHDPPKIELTKMVKLFEVLAKTVGVQLGPCHNATFGPLIHPIHQQGRIFGWEVLSYNQ